MDKRLLNSRGFILIEVMLVFVLFAFLSLINLSITNSSFNSAKYLKEIDVLASTINFSKQQAINRKQVVHLKFDQNTFIVHSEKYYKKYEFKSINFLTKVDLYFNYSGTFNQAKTLNFKHGAKYHKIIFYLGKGWYKIE